MKPTSCRPVWKTFLAFLLAELLILQPPVLLAQSPKPPAGLDPRVFQDLRQALSKSYLELFEEAPRLEFSKTQIERMRSYLKDARERCVDRFKQRREQYERDLQRTQEELRRRTARLTESERHELHCRIQNLRAMRAQAEVMEKHAVPTAYENLLAKLDIIEKWPDELKRIKEMMARGEHLKRKYGDYQDIGFREIAPGQEDDIRVGQEAIREMRMSGLMPPEVDNEYIQRYVRQLAEKIAMNSDLRVPVKVSVLNSKEINAFALPGGFIFVQRGLLEAVEDEAQLAGVLGHEIAHAAARHGHKLMRRATLAQIIYQAAQIAAMILTGGAVGIGTYYALQYGFYGLGLVLSLDLLGVSRAFELEADQLGVQYTWKAGYDTTGFIRFFDKMATREGYVNGLSWFRTHPPFYDRMVTTMTEIMFLPKQENPIKNTRAFDEMKKELEKVVAAAAEEEKERPSLIAPEAGCPKPEKIEYEPGQPIETVCETGQR